MPDTSPRYRPTKEELRARRALVSHFRPQYPNNAPGILAEIKKVPQFEDKPVDLTDIYNDMAFLRHNSGHWIATEFLPNLALDYQDTVNLMRMVVAESLRRYHEGDTETRTQETAKGTLKTVIHREGGYQWLALANDAQQAILKIGEQGPVVKQAHRIMQDYKRLLDLVKSLEEKGALPVAIESGQAS